MSNCGYYKTINGRVYGPYFHKPRPKKHFTPKDITRILTHARANNLVTDSELLNAWAISTNNKSILCTIAHMLQIGNLGTILVAVIIFVKGCLTLLKGLKILLSGKKSKIATSILELIVPKRYWEELGTFLTIIGGLEVVGGAMIIFLEFLIDDIVFKELIIAACEGENYNTNIENNREGALNELSQHLDRFSADISAVSGFDVMQEIGPILFRDMLLFNELTPLGLMLSNLENDKILDEALDGKKLELKQE